MIFLSKTRWKPIINPLFTSNQLKVVHIQRYVREINT